MSFRSLLTQTATIESETITHGSLGQSQRTWTSVDTNVPCRIQPKRKDYLALMGGEEETARYVGFFQYGVSLNAGNRLTVSDAAGTEIAKFIVTHVPVDVTGKRHHVEADLQFWDEATYEAD